MNLILTSTFASFLVGLATSLGALLIFFIPRANDKFLDASLGFSAGIMLAATFFSLILPSINLSGVYKTTLGIVLGAIFLTNIEKFTPHIHQIAGLKGPITHLSKVWLFILAITIHNLPEGLAVAVAFAFSFKNAVLLAIGIALQNIPEGLAVALPLLREKVSKPKAFIIGCLSGLVEPIAGFVGVILLWAAKFLLPYSLSFAAGCMLFVISEEIIPETHSRGNQKQATAGLIGGFVLMMILDNFFK